MRQEIQRQMRNFSGPDGDRIDVVAQALRRLFLRAELCPCGGLDAQEGIGPKDRKLCKQCELDLQMIEEAWIATEPVIVLQEKR